MGGAPATEPGWERMTIKNGGDEKQKPKILIKPRVPHAAKPEPDRADAATRLERSDKAIHPTIKPPKPPPESPPVSVRTGNMDGPITGEENTVAAPSAAAEVPRRSTRPPPPPQRPKTQLPEVGMACEQIVLDERPNVTPRDKANALAKLYDEQFRTDSGNPKVRILVAAPKRHQEELDLLVKSAGNDQQKFMALQEAARRKWDRVEPLDRTEDKIIELIHTKMAIEAFSRNDRDKFARFEEYITRKFKAAGTLNPLEKYLFEMVKLMKAAETTKAEADNLDRINNMRSSRRYSERYDRDKSPKGGTDRPSEKSPAPNRRPGPGQMPDEPAFVDNPDGKRISQPPPEEAARIPSNRPPASAMYRKEPGFFRRVFTDPMFWTTAGLAGVTSAIIYKDSFREIAQALRIIWRDKLHQGDFDFTRLHVIIGYSAILAVGLGLTILLRRAAVKKKALRYQELSEGSRMEKERKDRVIAKLVRISLDYEKFEDQVTHLRQALLQDAQFMSDLYELKKHRFFNDMLAEARIHPRLVQNLNIIFEKVKVEKLQKRLNKLANLLENPSQRCEQFKEYYERDPIFQMLIDELFERKGGNYVNQEKLNAAFHEVLNENYENVGQQLRKALGDDYESFRK